MIWFPITSYEIETNLPIDKVRNRLMAKIGQKDPAPVNYTRLFNSWVDQRTFKINGTFFRKSTQSARAFIGPSVFGRMETTANGTKVKYLLRFHILDWIILGGIVWALLLSHESTGHRVMFAGLYLLYMYFYSDSAKSTRIALNILVPPIK